MPAQDKKRLPGTMFNAPKAMLGLSAVQYLTYHQAQETAGGLDVLGLKHLGGA